MQNFRRHGISNHGRTGGFGSTPQYTPPPAAPPSASPPTLASSSVAASAAKQRNVMGAAGQQVGTPGGAEGVAPMSVTTGKATLGGVQ